MKKWLMILGVLTLAGIAFFGYRQWTAQNLRASLEETRRQLRQQGFRTDLADFNFTLPADLAARANAIILAGQAAQSLCNANDLDLMQTFGTNVALAISPVEVLPTDRATNLWPLVKGELASHDAELDTVCATLAAGSVRFQPSVIPGSGAILLRYLADDRNLARVLAIRAVLAMHEHNTNAVFTNLFALSRMVTAWSPEPVDVSHLVRFACERSAQQAIWEAMQTDYLNETQLASLQREWESARFFDGLPETAELSCASMVANCQARRDESYIADNGGWEPMLRGIFSSPNIGFQNLFSARLAYPIHARYRNRGSYEDEIALLIYHRDRWEELKRAVTCSTWAEMRSLPGATNIVHFKAAKWSPMGAMMNLRLWNLAGHSQGQGPTLLSNAASAETRRRLIVTALALERYAIQHREYPKSLADIVAAFLPAVPVDFMDGKELRYRRLGDGRYLLYSVGLDCVDNGGQMITPDNLASLRIPWGRFDNQGAMFLPPLDTDIVWPIRATQADLDLFDQQWKDYRGKSP